MSGQRLRDALRASREKPISQDVGSLPGDGYRLFIKDPDVLEELPDLRRATSELRQARVEGYLDSEGQVVGSERDPIVPDGVRPDLPDELHLPVGQQLPLAVFNGRHGF